MTRLKPFIKHIPFIILSVNGILILLSFKYEFDWMYWLIPQISGHGILTVIFMLFYAYTHRFCLYSFACIMELVEAEGGVPSENAMPENMVWLNMLATNAPGDKLSEKIQVILIHSMSKMIQRKRI